MVELLWALSNPTGPLKTLLEYDWSGAKQATDLIPPPEVLVGGQHRRMAWVTEAVERVLTEHGKPMHAKAVHAGVEALLSEPVRWGSVKAALADGARRRSPRFVRLSRGRYTLVASRP